MEPVRLISPKEVTRRTSLSVRSIDRKVAAGKFPAPVSISDYRKAYIETEVDAWIAEHIARGRGQKPKGAMPS